MKTAVGVLAVDCVARIDRSQITGCDATAAGHRSLPELLSRLDSREGEIYRIQIRFAGADPRLALREIDQLDQSSFQQVQARLACLDSTSRQGAWPRAVLQSIDRHPRIAAAELGEKTGLEKEWLKRNIRKLKNLGLTISHQPGYELSPRGKAVLAHLEGDV